MGMNPKNNMKMKSRMCIFVLKVIRILKNEIVHSQWEETKQGNCETCIATQQILAKWAVYNIWLSSFTGWAQAIREEPWNVTKHEDIPKWLPQWDGKAHIPDFPLGNVITYSFLWWLSAKCNRFQDFRN